MKRYKNWVLAGVLFSAGCAAYRVSGYKNPASEPESQIKAAQPQEEVHISPSAVPGQQETFTPEELSALYYYDLGPSSIDVSRYPPGQKENYALFARTCSQCHTLARPINSPRNNYVAWKYYIFRMRMRSKSKPGARFTEEEGARILDFLTYDALVRKDEYREDFEEMTRRLERRFDRTLQERMRRLQEEMPPPHRSAAPSSP